MFEIASVKILFTIFALFAWSRAFARFRQGLLNVKEMIFWTLLWGGLTVLVFIPGKSDLLARILGMKRGLDAMFFIGMVILYYAIYRLYAIATNHEKQMTELIRKIALENEKKK